MMNRVRKVSVNAAKKSMHAVTTAGTGIAKLELPKSIDWMYGMGFKLGIYLIIKTFLIWRYQLTNLAFAGHVILLSQLGLAVVMIACGAILQNPQLYNNPYALRNYARIYGVSAAICTAIAISKDLLHWEYFKDPRSVNWFADFFSFAAKGLGELGLTILFFDVDFLILFCWLLFAVAYTYLNASFPYAHSPLSALLHGGKSENLPTHHE